MSSRINIDFLQEIDEQRKINEKKSFAEFVLVRYDERAMQYAEDILTGKTSYYTEDDYAEIDRIMNPTVAYFITKDMNVPKTMLLCALPYLDDYNYILSRDDLTEEEFMRIYKHIDHNNVLKDVVGKYGKNISENNLKYLCNLSYKEWSKFDYKILQYINEGDSFFRNILDEALENLSSEEKAMTSIVNNSTVWNNRREAAFENGCDISEIEQFTDKNAITTYCSLIEVLFDETADANNMENAYLILKKMIDKKVLSQSLQLDFFNRYNEFIKTAKDYHGMELAIKLMMEIARSTDNLSIVKELIQYNDSFVAVCRDNVYANADIYKYLMKHYAGNQWNNKMMFLDYLQTYDANTEFIKEVFAWEDMNLNKLIITEFLFTKVYEDLKNIYIDKYRVYFDLAETILDAINNNSLEDKVDLSQTIRGALATVIRIDETFSTECINGTFYGTSDNTKEKKVDKMGSVFVNDIMTEELLKKSKLGLWQIKESEYQLLKKVIKKLKKTYKRKSEEKKLINNFEKELDAIYQYENIYRKYQHLFIGTRNNDEYQYTYKFNINELLIAPNKLLKEFENDIIKEKDYKVLEIIKNSLIREISLQIEDVNDIRILCVIDKLGYIYNLLDERLNEKTKLEEKEISER